VVQIVVKPKGGKKEDLKERYDEVLAAIQLDEPVEFTVDVLADFIARALSILRHDSKLDS